MVNEQPKFITNKRRCISGSQGSPNRKLGGSASHDQTSLQKQIVNQGQKDVNIHRGSDDANDSVQLPFHQSPPQKYLNKNKKQMHKESHKNISRDRMFHLNLNVVSETHTTNVALFGEVVDVLARCSVKEYIDYFEKDPINSQKYEQLGKSVWKEYKFLFKLDKSNVKGDNFSTIAEAVELLTKEYLIDDNNTKTMVDVK
ncbi:hypothetical protein Leryth_006668 [Lithospermum erythrorhizon]|nr:hypothetical protein Leryth_006668 [Lithospermum erythrorhizon]